MQNKFLNIVMILFALFLVIITINSTVKYSIFFGTKKTAEGKILIIKDAGPQEPLDITIEYENSYLKKTVSCTIAVKKSYGKLIRNKSVINVDYGNYFPCNIYLTDYKSPSRLIIFLNSIVVFLLFIAIIALYKKIRTSI